MRVSLLGREGTLPWRYEKDSLIVDFSAIPYSQIPGRWAWTLRLSGYEGQAPPSPLYP